MEPPDVTYEGFNEVKNPKVQNFIDLMNWAFTAKDDYLYKRACESMLAELFNNGK